MKNLVKIVDHYGKAQLDIAQEELAELIQAISKYKRYGTVEQLEEEIADVEIMIEQIMLLTPCRERNIDLIRKEKINKTLKRIKDEKTKKATCKD